MGTYVLWDGIFIRDKINRAKLGAKHRLIFVSYPVYIPFKVFELSGKILEEAPSTEVWYRKFKDLPFHEQRNTDEMVILYLHDAPTQHLTVSPICLSLACS